MTSILPRMVRVVDPIDGTLNFVHQQENLISIVFISMVNLMQVLILTLWLMSYIMLSREVHIVVANPNYLIILI